MNAFFHFKKGLLFFLSFTAIISYAQIKPESLSVEYLKNPLGLQVENPRLFWKLSDPEFLRNTTQSACQIQVSTRDDFKSLVWDTRKMDTDVSTHIKYQGEKLNSASRYFWRVKVWDNHGRVSDWSETAFWETGFFETSDWLASWIEPVLEEDPNSQNPAPILRREFKSRTNIKKARLFISSHGLYEVFINGNRVGDDYFTPGWTSFHKRLQYQVYDVGELIEKKNCIGVRLGDGWYRGKFGFSSRMNMYGETLALMVQLEIEYENGKKLRILSDDSWKCSQDGILLSGIYDGEIFDARLMKEGWNLSGYYDKNWSPVKEVKVDKSKLMGSRDTRVRKIEEISAQKLFFAPNGDTLIDMGQNMVGWIRFMPKGEAGEKLIIEHAEVLDKKGNFYTDNLRTAAQRTEYICSGEEKEYYEPRFTFQGFRYIRLKGFSNPASEDFKGVVVHSDMEPTGFFECSDTLVNQLQHNIIWGQKGNFVDVPTDCPQRNERMGWTGDAQVFAPTACYNFNTAALYTRWLGDVKADQGDNGAVSDVIPDVLGWKGSIGWGDVATILPWTLYIRYGDADILEKQYASMRSWVNFLESLAGEDLIIREGRHYGDWLYYNNADRLREKPGFTDMDLLATSFLAHSTRIMSKTAAVLNKKAEEKLYQDKWEKIGEAFRNEFLAPSGRLSSHSQTAYTLALAFDLIDTERENKSYNYLRKNIQSRGNHLSTGFLGTPHLCHVLTKYGGSDLAMKLLLQKSYPSWLYPVTMGATTIWERWDGIKPDGSFQSAGMNSFNHYAYGAIGDWMYQVLGGIRADESAPGYKKIVLKPYPANELNYVKTFHESLYGKIVSEWKKEDGDVFYHFEVPPNTSAEIILQKNKNQNITGMSDVKIVSEKDGLVKMAVGSGVYDISIASGKE